MTNKRLYETYPLWSEYQRAWFNRIDDLKRPFLSFLNVRYVLAITDPPEGWRIVAEDRGTVKPHFANHAFLGVFVPQGRHRIQLKYLPESFMRGRNISLATLAFLGMAGLCYRTRACSRFFSTWSRQQP